MAGPSIPVAASAPIPPPLGWVALVDPLTGVPTIAGYQFLQLLWAAIQGKGGLIDAVGFDLTKLGPGSLSPLVADLENLRTAIYAQPDYLPVIRESLSELRTLVGLLSGQVALASANGGTVTTVQSTNESSSFNVTSAFQIYYVGPTGGALTATLPAAPALNDQYLIVDATGQASVNPISLAGNGNTINGSANISNWIQVPYGWGRLIYNGTIWNMI